MKAYSTAIFDCDGVILDSNSIKTEAFREALKVEPTELVDEFINYHKKNGGVSRYEKISYYFTSIAPVSNKREMIEKTLHEYGEICRSSLKAANFIPGVEEILAQHVERGISNYVVSGGDEEELVTIFNEKGIDGFFKKICGSPCSKIQNMEILRKSSVLKYPVVFFGDAESDYKCAARFDCEFVLIYGASEWAGWQEKIQKHYYRDFSHFRVPSSDV